VKWGLDFVRLVKLVGQSIGNMYTLIGTNYATKWMEVNVLCTNMIAITIKFLYELMLTRFGCPLTIVIDYGVHFINDAIKYLTNHFMLKHLSSTTYYPHETGQVESTNKLIRTLINKLVNENKVDWEENFPLYFYHIITIGYIPYQLVYGLHPLMLT